MCLKALSLFMCLLRHLSVLCLPLSFPSVQVNLLNSLLNITNIWYISISTWSSLYQIFSKAISHPFRSQFSLCISISFITAIFRIFFYTSCLNSFIRFSCSAVKGIVVGFFWCGLYCFIFPILIYHLMDFISTFHATLILKITINSGNRGFPRSISLHCTHDTVVFPC